MNKPLFAQPVVLAWCIEKLITLWEFLFLSMQLQNYLRKLSQIIANWHKSVVHIGVEGNFLAVRRIFFPNFPKFAWKIFMRKTFLISFLLQFITHQFWRTLKREVKDVLIKTKVKLFWVKLIYHSITNTDGETSVPEFSTNLNFWGCIYRFCIRSSYTIGCSDASWSWEPSIQ